MRKSGVVGREYLPRQDRESCLIDSETPRATNLQIASCVRWVGIGLGDEAEMANKHGA